EVVLEGAPDPQQRRVPLEPVVDAVEATVVQLVEHPERELRVGLVVGYWGRDRGDRVGSGRQEGVTDPLAEGAAGSWELHGHAVPPPRGRHATAPACRGSPAAATIRSSAGTTSA